MKTYIHLLFLLLLLSPTVVAQDSTVLFNKTYFSGDSIAYIMPNIELHDNGYLVTGGKNTADNSVIVAEVINEYGEIIKEYYLDTVSSYYINQKLIINQNGNYIYGYNLNGEGGAPNLDIRLIEFTANGDILWHKEYGGNASEAFTDIVQTFDGGYLLVGNYWPFTQSGNFMETEYYLLKVDSLGNELWNKTYKYENYNSKLLSVVNTPDGGFLVGGSKFGGSLGSFPEYLKIDSLGSIEWTEQLIGDCHAVIVPMFDGGYLISTCIDVGINYEMFVRRLDSNFEIIWEKNLDKVISSQAVLISILPQKHGGFLATSTHYNDEGRIQPLIIDFDYNGNINWSKGYTIDSTENCSLDDIHLTADGGYVLSGAQLTTFNKGWVLRVDSLGRSCSIPDCDTTVLTACMNTPDSTLCCATIDEHPIPQFSFIKDNDSLTLQLINETVNNYEGLANGVSYLWDFGDGQQSTTFDIIHQFSEANYYNITLSSIICGDTLTELKTIAIGEPTGLNSSIIRQIKVYPNPATTTITFDYLILETNEILFLYNSLGQLIQEIELMAEANRKTISTENISEGIYYWHLGNASGKFVISKSY